MLIMDIEKSSLSAEEVYKQMLAEVLTGKDKPKETEPKMKLYFRGKELKPIHIDDIREVVEFGRFLFPLDFCLSFKNVLDLEEMSLDKNDLHMNYEYLGFVFGLAYSMGYGVRKWGKL